MPQSARELLASSPRGSSCWTFDPDTAELSHGSLLVPLSRLHTNEQVSQLIGLIARMTSSHLVLEQFIVSLSRHLKRNGESVSLRGAA